MARPPTRHSRLSVGMISSSQSIVDRDAGDTGAVFSVLGDYALTGAGTLTGDQAITGALTVSTSLAVGGGTTLEKISVTTHSVDFGSVTSLVPSSIVTVGITGVADGDFVMAMHPSLWSGDYEALDIKCTSGDTTGEVNLYATNSGITAIDSAAAVVNILHINF